MELNEIEVIIKYGDIEKKITGEVDLVLREMLNFFTEIYPDLNLLSKISLNVNLEDFLRACEGIFASTPEGIVTLTPYDQLPDRELILLQLTKAKLGYLLKKYPKDTLFISNILSITKRTAGTVAGRLSEMCSEDLVERVGKGEYRITTFGIDFFLKNILPQLRK